MDIERRRGTGRARTSRNRGSELATVARNLSLLAVVSCATPAAPTTPTAASPTTAPPPSPAVAVGAQYDTTHVYVNAADVDRFATSFLATFGGHSTKQVIVTVTPTPSTTSSQLLQTPVGTVSLFGFRTGIPFPFGSERDGYLVSDMDAALQSARAAGADVIVAPYNDPIGRDAVVQWPGGVDMQLYWHTKTPSYEPFQNVPENRVYVSPDRADAFVKSFVAFSHGNIVADEPRAPGADVGAPDSTFHRIRIESAFGKMAVLVTDGHVAYPFGYENTGYEVANLGETLAKARASGADVLVAPYHDGDRDAAMVEFPGGYVAEIHARSTGELPSITASAATAPNAPIGRADIDTWAAAWNSHDIETVLALFSPEVVIHQPANPKPLDFAAARGFFSMIFQAYPDFHVEIVSAVVEGTTGVSIERITGTWSGPYTDPATHKTTRGNNRKFDHPGVMVLAYSPDHKIKQVDIYWDRLIVDQQLGIAP
jgi:steroid delta-isomerase-like uncharacterized protein